MQRRGEPAERRASPAMLVAVLALFAAIAGSASAGAPDSVVSTDIVDGTIRSADVANDGGPAALQGTDVALGGLTGADVADDAIGSPQTIDGTLLGIDVAADAITGGLVTDGSITGADITESTLGQVPTALNSQAIDGVAADNLVIARGDGSDTGECSGSLTVEETCADVTIDIPFPGHVLLSASGTWHTFAGDTGLDPGAECRIFRDIPITYTAITMGDENDTFQPIAHVEGFELPFALQSVTQVLAPGSYTFELLCMNLDQAEGDIDEAYISVVAIADGA